MMLDAMLSKIRSQFPLAPQLSTTELEAMLQRCDDAQVVLIDTRTRPEYEISHLRDAIWIDPKQEKTQMIAMLQAEVLKRLQDPIRFNVDLHIVCYCSVGWRSSQVVETVRNDLIKHGNRVKMWNLEGSAFKWANEGRPLVDAAGSTVSYVHPYDRVFGQMLEQRLWRFPDQSKSSSNCTMM